MTFRELLQNETYADTYLGWYSVKEAKDLGLITKDFAEYIPDTCKCGSEYIVKSNLKQMMCCDENCPIKQGCKLAKIFSDFQIDGVGQETCKTVYNALVEHNKVVTDAGYPPILKNDSYLATLEVEWDQYPALLKNVATSKFCMGAKQIISTKITYPKLLGMLAIKGLGSNSEKIFSGISSYEELEAEIAKYNSFAQFCASRGVGAPELIYNIQQALPDIKYASELWKDSIRKQGHYIINVCITGSIKLGGKSLTKQNFISLCNQTLCLSNGYQLFEVKMNSAVESNNFILYTTPSSSSKFQIGQRRGKITDGFGEHDVLMTVDDFYVLLRSKVKEVDQKVKEKQSESQEVVTQSQSFGGTNG